MWNIISSISLSTFLLLVLMAGCEEEESDLATCAEYADKLEECGEDPETADALLEMCEPNVKLGTYQCILACDVEGSCDDYDCCISECEGGSC